MKLNDKVKVTLRGSVFHNCVGYIRGMNTGQFQVEIHEIGKKSNPTLDSIMLRPVGFRLYWFRPNELKVMPTTTVEIPNPPRNEMGQ